MITSRTNGAVKAIRSLRQRAERDSSGTFFLEGVRLVGEALEAGAPVQTVVHAPDLLTSRFGRETVRHLEECGTMVLEVSADVFRSISLKDGPQGIGAVVQQRWESLAQIVPGDELCWVALDEVADPGNLGTILRTCDAVGAAGVILLGTATDPYDPSALRASMGAVFSQRLVRSHFKELETWAREHRCTLVGTSDRSATDYAAARYQRPMVLLMGSERMGLSPSRQSACDLMVSIPMVGRSDSLNLAVATAVVLYGIFNQQRAATAGAGASQVDLASGAD